MGLDTYPGGALFVIGSGILAVLGLLLTRRLIDLNGLRASHDVGGYLLSVVGTLYAVLLGLIVVDAMQKFQQARDITEREANSLADIFILSSCLEEPKREEIKKFCIDYSNQVLNTEWQDMDSGSYCPVARRMAVSLLQELIEIEPKTETQKVLFAQMVADASQVWQCRRTRINMVMDGVPAIEWITLIVGGIITVFFTFFFGLENLRLQIAMTAMVAMLISLNMYLVILFGYPFSGDLKISTEAFRINQGIYENRISSQAR
jgi:hypothetical protein